MPFSGFGDFDPRFAGALQQFIAANPGVSVFSGYRTPARQAQLFANSDQSGHWVARNSLHTQRLAADLAFNGQRFSALPRSQIEALQQSAGGYGLKFPMSWEAWHVEPYWTRGGHMAGGGGLPSYVNTGAIEGGGPGAGADYAGSPGNMTTPTSAPSEPLSSMPWDIFSNGQLPRMGTPEPPPMTPERFLMGMIGGQNPLRQMVLGSVLKLFA